MPNPNEESLTPGFLIDMIAQDAGALATGSELRGAEFAERSRVDATPVVIPSETEFTD